MSIIKLVKKGAVKLWKSVSKTTYEGVGFIALSYSEIDKFDLIQNKYLKVMCGSQSMNYISDREIYLRSLRILKCVELEMSERLFLISILEKYCNILYKEKKYNCIVVILLYDYLFSIFIPPSFPNISIDVILCFTSSST